MKPDLKLILVGNDLVGKSALTMQKLMGFFLEDHDDTIADTFQLKIAVKGTVYNVELTDTGKWNDLKDEWNKSVKDGDGFLIVFSLDNPNTFEDAVAIREEIIRLKSDDEIPTVIAGNKLDLAPCLPNLEYYKEYCEMHEIPLILTSAKSRIGVDEVFSVLIEVIREKNENKAKQKIEVGKRCCEIM